MAKRSPKTVMLTLLRDHARDVLSHRLLLHVAAKKKEHIESQVLGQRIAAESAIAEESATKKNHASARHFIAAKK